MHADQLLIPFSWVFLGVLSLLILVPYLRGRSDMVTAWNLFLLGSTDFVAISALVAAYSTRHNFYYSDADYWRFMLGVVVFYTTLVIAYYSLKFPRRWAGRHLRKWPPLSGRVLFFMVSCAIFLVGLPILLPWIPVVSQLLFQLGTKAIAFAVLLAFVAWYQQKANPFLFSTLLCALVLCLIVSVLIGGGRRTLVSVLVSFPIALYWLKWRDKNPVRNLLFVGVLGLVGLVCLVGYASVRWFDLGTRAVERNLANSVKALMQLPSQLAELQASDLQQLAGQNSVEYSLMAIHMYGGRMGDDGAGQLDRQPFHSLVFMLTWPIPRAIWPDKPLNLGYNLLRDYGRTGEITPNCGPGIIGHGYHEGGVHVLIVYAVLCAAGLRFFDELLIRQPGNPYLLGILAASSGHIIGWPRGDIAVMTLHIITAFLSGIVFAWIGRLLCGTGLVYPQTDHLDVRRTGIALSRA